MKVNELIRIYLNFFKNKGHKIINSAPLIPENDPTILFTTAGMHPLVPFLLGQSHPQGKRLVDVQKCIRTNDIDEVGDDTHLTFFEMLGNWSLGDYFKKEAIGWSFEFLTKLLNFNKDDLFVTVFKGDDYSPRDVESKNIWVKQGIKEEHIFFLPKEDNWWGLESGGPCGPDSEIFFDTKKPKCSVDCKPGCSCGKYVEIWNNVFMEYDNKNGKLYPLIQKNVDTGLGVERTVAMLNNKKSVYDISLFSKMFNILNESTKSRSARIIIDHIRAATMILGDEIGVIPSKNGQGYVLRRLIRRAVRHIRLLNKDNNLLLKISEEFIKLYKDRYDSVGIKKDFILKELNNEIKRFELTLEKGLKIFNDLIKKNNNISGKNAFLLYQSYGFPIEMIKELCNENNIEVDINGFNIEQNKHKERSKSSSKNVFKGGLSETNENTIKLHTATHLLAQALREIIDKDIVQKGSNINSERLRFDFNLNRKLTGEELKKVEDLVNDKIKQGLPVIKKEMSLSEAKKLGAQAEFSDKYGDKVFVYFIDDFSKEVCGGPHVKNTKELGHFKIVKEKSIASGVRRIKAILE